MSLDHFGVCPTCKKNDGSFNCGAGHWYVCHEHRVRWYVGSNLFSSWRDQTEEEQRHAYDVDPGWGSYEHIMPEPEAYDAPHLAPVE